MKKQMNALLSFLFVVLAFSAFSQTRTVSGNVTDESGEPAIGATVKVTDTSLGAVAGVDGNFTINDVPTSAKTLTISSIGYSNKVVAISDFVKVSLAGSDEVIDDIVVIGYGTQEKTDLIQSISTVSAKDVENVPVASPLEALQGKAPGVQVTTNSGVSGSQSKITIRGVASVNASARPLVVIDGVIMSGSSLSSTSGAVGLDPLRNIDPNSIESFSVLKDASAKAIYGARAANGVILITTKKGKKEGGEINFSYNTSVTDAVEVYDMMSADQFRTFRSELLTARGTPTSPSDFPQESFDWVDAVRQVGMGNRYHVDFSGASDNINYYIGGSYEDQESYVIGNNLSKLSGQFNISSKVKDYLRVGTNISINRTQSDRISSDNSTYAPFTTAFLQTPWVQPKNERGEFVNTGFLQNVIGLEALSKTDLIDRRSYGNVFAEFDLIKDLQLRTSLGMDMFQTEEVYRFPDVFEKGGRGGKDLRQDNRYISTTTLSYNKDFSEKISLNTLFGFEYEDRQIKYTGVESTGYALDQLQNVDSGSEPTNTSSNNARDITESEFARVAFNYGSKYLLEGSIRRDGFSRFGSDKKYGWFPSVGAGWIVSDEAFMANQEIFDLVKVKFGWGEVGNNLIPRFRNITVYDTGADYGGNPGFEPGAPGNTNLTWETTREYNVGINTTFLSNKIDFTAEYFNRKTKDLLFGLPTPAVGGLESQPFTNLEADLRNSGFEFGLTTVNIDRNDFNWTTNFNLATLKNEVKSLPSAIAQKDSEGRNYVGGTSQRAIEGYSLNTFYLVRYNGIDSQTGDATFLDKDGNVTVSPNFGNDRVIVGGGLPKVTGGLNNTLTYKGFDFNSFFSYSFGGNVYLGEQRFTDNGLNRIFNKQAKLLNYWKKPGDKTYYPSLTSETLSNFTANGSSRYLQKADYVKLRSASLGYNFGNLKGLGFVKGARFFVQGRNLITITNKDFTGLDPEVNNSASSNALSAGFSFFTPPQAKTILAGVNFKF